MNETQIKGFRIHDEGGVKTIRQKVSILGRIFLFGFMSVWMTGWTAGCAALTVGLIGKFSFLLLLFAMPFYVGWFAGAAVLLATFSPGSRVTAERTALHINKVPLLPLLRRQIPFKEISRLHIQNNDDYHTLVVESSGKDADLFSSSKKKDLEAVRDFLVLHIPTLHQSKEEVPDKVQRPDVARHRTTRPEETQWKFESGLSGETRLVNRGSFETVSALCFLGVCLFWNGIVSMFVVQAFNKALAGNIDWFEVFFLVPFVLIGIGILLFTLLVWFDPFRHFEYTFSQRKISSRHSYFGIGISKVWNLAGALNVWIIYDGGLSELAEGDDYELAFFTKNDPQDVKIGPLTLAEAEWIATELEKRQAFNVERKIEDWKMA